MLRPTQIIILFVVCLGAFFIYYKKASHSEFNRIEILQVAKNLIEPKSQVAQNIGEPQAANVKDLTAAAVQNIEGVNLQDEIFMLTSQNMGANILKCFQGTHCEISEDAWKIYQELKDMKNSKLIDLYLSFLRSKLKDPNFKDLYREDLKRMIDDFYPATEKEFQDAAYYSYLGESQKSLDLYMDLRQRSDNDSSLRQAPNMNIANVLYDLNRQADALIYYQMALNDLESKKQVSPDQEETMRFLESRIKKIKEGLGTQEEEPE